MSKIKPSARLLIGAVAVCFAASLAVTSARQSSTAAPALDKNDIGGVVTGPKGPEAGVWVIAETTGLPTKYAKIVVTDDRGRYVLPDLPDAKYSVWVRGYGLVDSPKMTASPGQPLNLTATVAPDPHAAAQYYPAGYWFSMLQVPAKSEFPGTGPSGNGISPNLRSQAEWLRVVKNGTCLACHQLGNKATREIPAALGTFATTAQAWERRLQSGQAGLNMIPGLNQLGRERALALFADWTDRIAKGELPPAPPRPQGLERNAVITMWD
ncbi:MAG: carboxypeptidase-like regulatory domain-containing protein, partial [Vicinamibacterales bacterium]